MHLLRDQKALPRCEVGGEKFRVDDAREDCRNIKQKERKHVELGGLAQRALGLRAHPVRGAPSRRCWARTCPAWARLGVTWASARCPRQGWNNTLLKSPPSQSSARFSKAPPEHPQSRESRRLDFHFP